MTLVFTTNRIFPTLIVEARLPDAERLNGDLVRLLRDMESADAGVQATTTVNRGWQSDRALLERDEPCIRALRDHFAIALAEYFRHAETVNQEEPTPGRLVYEYKGWGVIIRSAGFQDQHVHSRTDVVGVYCVQAEARETAEGRGDLVLIDPRPGRLSSRPYWETSTVRFPPVPGRLVLMPSYVPHRVEVYSGTADRITINFDIAITGLRA
jgi:uncharacterized protein (TIGR02466 family)